MSSLSAAITSLQVSQRALDIISNNLANANTPGYHRQVARLASAEPLTVGNFSFGQGVNLEGIGQVRSEVLERAFTRQQGDNGRLESALTLATRLESEVSTDEGSALARIENLFNDLQQLSTRLNEPGLRNVIVNQADGLTKELNGLAGGLRLFQQDVDQQIALTVRDVNTFSKQIAELNVQIARSENQSIPAADLRDQRDQLINNLGQLVDIDVSEGNSGQATVISNGAVLVIGSNATGFQTNLKPDQAASIKIQNTDTLVEVRNGKLAGLLDIRNGLLADTRREINQVATQLIRSFDAIHSQGVGLTGGFARLEGQRAVDDINAPLNQAGLDFPPQSGDLFIGVTNTATKERIVYKLPPLSPGALSLSGLAAAITTATTPNTVPPGQPRVQGYANSESGTLNLQAAPGFTFDFGGGFDTKPGVVGGGTPLSTSSLTLGGANTNTGNDQYSFRFSGAGQIGGTDGLLLTVTDQAGNNVGEFNIGRGYAAGTALRLSNGVTVSVSAGQVDPADEFTSSIVGNSDTGGFLPALGLNTFFTGRDAESIKVNADLLKDPRRLATSRTGQPGDSSNLQRLLGTRDDALFAEGTLDFNAFSTSIVARIGTKVQTSTQDQETAESLLDRITAEREGLSGVDPNEELVHMVKFQKQFEIAAKFIATVNQTLDELLRIVG